MIDDAEQRQFDVLPRLHSENCPPEKVSHRVVTELSSLPSEMDSMWTMCNPRPELVQCLRGVLASIEQY